MATKGDLPYGSYLDSDSSSWTYLNSCFSARRPTTAYVDVPEEPDGGQQEDDHVGYEQSRIEIQDQQRHHRTVEHEQSDGPSHLL